VCPAQRVDLFVNIFAPPNSLGTTAVCIKIFEKYEGILGDHTSLMEGGVLKTGVFSPISCFIFENSKSYGHSYSGRRIGTHM